MPKTESDSLGPHFGWRLRAELDRIQPRYSSPRYLSRNAARRVGPWRFAPVALAIGLTGIVGMSAWAATGSTNPAVWTERARSVIHAVPPAASPVPTPESTPPAAQLQAAPPAAPVRQSPAGTSEQPEPTKSPEPSSSPKPKESPEPTGGDSSKGPSGGSGAISDSAGAERL